MTNHDELCEKKWVEQLKQFMAHYGFHIEWSEWTYNDFTALKDWIQLELLHENASLKLKLEEAEKEIISLKNTVRCENEKVNFYIDKSISLESKLSGSCEKSIICQDCGGSGSLGKAKDGRLISCESCGGHEDSLGSGYVSGSCEGMTSEEIRLAVLDGFREAEKLINPLDRLTYGDECHVIALVVQKIHAQMTGGKK